MTPLPRLRSRTAPTPPPTVLPRERGTYVGYVHRSHYGDYDEDVWEPSPDGRLQSSALPGGDHAPVLDVDRPIVATATPTGTTLTVPDVRAWRARRVLDRLTATGLLAEPAPAVPADARPWHRVPVTFTLPGQVHVHPSRTPGHHHVLVNTPMSWAQMHTLVSALAGPVVDKQWAHACALSLRFVIARPIAYDPCC